MKPSLLKVIVASALISFSSFGAATFTNEVMTATSITNLINSMIAASTNFTGGGGIIYLDGFLLVDSSYGDDETAFRSRLDLPFATPGAAISNAVSGDTIVIRPGTYDIETLYYESDIGEIAPQLYLHNLTNVTVLGHGAELVANEYGNMLTIEGCERITIEGLTFRGSTNNIGTRNIAAAINHRGTNYHTTVMGCSFIDIPDQAISHCWPQYNRPSYYWTIQNNWFHNIGQTNHPGVVGGTGTLPDGAMVSGRPRRLIFTGNRSTGLNAYGVEFDGGGYDQPGNDSEIRRSVVANNVLEGIYWQGIVLQGYGTSPVTDIAISGNTISYHDTIIRPGNGGLFRMSGVYNVVIANNTLWGPLAADGAGAILILLDNSLGDGNHPVTRGLAILNNNLRGGSHGIVISQTPGVAELVSGVRIANNIFRAQGASHISVSGRNVHITENTFLGCGVSDPIYSQAVRMWDFTNAPATGFVFRNNILADETLPNALTTRFLRGFSNLTPRTPLDVRDNRIIRMSLTDSMPYEFSSDTPMAGDTSTLTDAAAIATPAAEGSVFRVTLGGNRTLSNPTNPYDGQRVSWEIIQDGTGSRTITLGDKFVEGLFDVTLSTTAGATDILEAIYSETADKWYVVGFTGNVGTGDGDTNAWLADTRARTANLNMGGNSVTNIGAMAVSNLYASTLTLNGQSDGSNFTNIFGVTATNNPAAGDVLVASGSGNAEWSAAGTGYQSEFGFGLTGTTNVALYSLAVNTNQISVVPGDETDWVGPTNTIGVSLPHAALKYYITNDVEITGITGTIANKRAGAQIIVRNESDSDWVIRWPTNWFRYANLKTEAAITISTNQTAIIDITSGWTTNIIGYVSQQISENIEIATILIDEDMEGSGTPTGWYHSASNIDWDDSTTILAGSESLYIGPSGSATNFLVDSHLNLHVYALVLITNYPSATFPLISLRDASNVTHASLSVTSSGKVITYSGGANSTQTSTAIALNTTNHVWVTFISGGTCYATFSTDGSKPTTGGTYTSATGSEADVEYIALRSSSVTAWFADNLKVSTQPIGAVE